MTINEVTQLVTAIGITVGAIGGVVAAILSYLTRKQLHPLAKQITQIEHHGNSAQAELLRLAKENSRTKGRAEESAAADVGKTTVGTPLTPEAEPPTTDT